MRTYSRRKLGNVIADPIFALRDSNRYDSLVMREKDHTSAAKTRAAALMFIRRHDIDMTTSVKGDEVWIMKDKDNFWHTMEVDLR